MSDFMLANSNTGKKYKIPYDKLETALQNHKELQFESDDEKYRAHQYHKEQESQKGWGGALKDIGSMALDAPSEAWEGLKGLGRSAVAAGGQFKEHPFKEALRAVEGIGAGAVTGAKEMALLPVRAGQFAGRHNILGAENILPALDKIESFAEKDRGIQKAIMGDPQPGDEFFESLGRMINPASRGFAAASTPSKLARLELMSAGEDQNPFVAPIMMGGGKLAGKAADRAVKKPIEKWQNKRELSKLEQDILEHSKQFEEKDQSLESLKKSMMDDPYISADTPKSLKNRTNTAKRKLDDINQQLEEIEQNAPPSVDETPRLPRPEPIDHVSEAQKNLDNAQRDYKEYINPKDDHNVQAWDNLRDEFQYHKAKHGQPFEEVKEELKGKSHKIVDNSGLKKLYEDLMEHVDSEYTPDVANLQEQIQNFKPDVKEIPANTLVDQWRTVDRMAKQAEADSRQRDISPMERTQYKEKAKSLSGNAKKLYSMLEETAPPETLEKLNKAREGWAKNVVPLYEQKIHKQVMNKDLGRLNVSDPINEISGNSRGAKIIRDMVLSNPKLIRNFKALSHKGKPESLIELRKIDEPYIESSPQLQGMKERLAEAFKELPVKQKMQQAENEKHQRFVDSMNELLEKKKIETKDRAKYEQNKSKHMENAREEQENIKRYEDALKVLQKEMDEHKGTKEALDAKVARKKELEKKINASQSKLTKYLQANFYWEIARAIMKQVHGL